jgi:hypothetical protein
VATSCVAYEMWKMKTRKEAIPRMPSSHAVGCIGLEGFDWSAGRMVVWTKVGRRKKELRLMA